MDEVYHGRLSAHPHAPTEPDIHIPQSRGKPIPVQLPNIYVNSHPAPLPPALPKMPTIVSPAPRATMKLGSWKFTKPHPLLWISLVLSVIALVLGVPKGSLPTLTGRHKELRAREKIGHEKLHLLSHLSHFLPPPLAHLVHPSNGNSGETWTLADQSHSGLKFWSSGHGHRVLDRAEQGRWWSVEEIGEGASVVRSSRGIGGDKEVWVLKMGETADPNRPLLSALTHSLLLRDKLQQDLDDTRSRSVLVHPPPSNAPGMIAPSAHLALGNGKTDDREEQQELIKDEWERLEMRKKRDKEREREVVERERAVADREKWVVDEMKRMSEKVHSQASELTLEDRITERLKAYQRQMAQLKTEPQADGAVRRGGDSASKDL